MKFIIYPVVALLVFPLSVDMARAGQTRSRDGDLSVKVLKTPPVAVPNRRDG